MVSPDITDNAAGNKMTRLLANIGLGTAVAKVISDLDLVTEKSFVNVDHSDFNGLVALVFAVQTRIGRALPVFLETSYSGKLSKKIDASKRIQIMRAAYDKLKIKTKTNETKRTITSLKLLRKTLGFWPKLVFDRGFGSRDIIRLLTREKATFYVRLKAGRLVEITGLDKAICVSMTKRADMRVTIAGVKLRLIRSPKVGGDKNNEPWYILTNDLTSSRNRIVKIYYHRFEIEETFRDIKTILGLRSTKLYNPESLANILWFASLGIIILYLAGVGVMGIKALIEKLTQPHPKKKLSWYRILVELRETEICGLRCDFV
jgi:hypothetical protein